MAGSMLGIEDINLDTKIQRRISKQHSTILRTEGKKSAAIYLQDLCQWRWNRKFRKLKKKSFLCGFGRDLKFCEEQGTRGAVKS